MKNISFELISVTHWFLALWLVTTASCKRESTFDDEFDPRKNKETSITWDFSNASKYSFDSTFIEVNGGKASLKSVDQIFSGADLNSGSHVGTYYDSTNYKIGLRTQPDTDSTHVNTILPSKSSNLIGYWRFDGTWISSDGAANELTPNNTLTQAGSTPFLGTGAALFPGLTDSATANISGIENKGTFNFWVYKKAGAAYHYIFDTTPSGFRYLLFHQGGQWHLFLAGTLVQGNMDLNIPDEEWTMITISFDRVTATDRAAVFKNGERLYTSTTNFYSSTTDSPSTLFLGSRYSSLGSDYWEGQMDEVSLWNDRLSDQEILTLYDTQKGNFTELSSSWTPHWDKIVGYWKMDGNWRDSSGNGNHGTANGDADFSNNSKIGVYSATFDGVGDYMSAPDNDVLDPTELSVSAWFYSADNSGDGNIISKGQNLGYRIRIQSGSNRIRFFDRGGANILDSVSTIQENRWYHIIVTGDSTGLKIYLNGKLDSSNSSPYGSPNSGLGLWIGSMDGGFEFFNGKIDEAAVWSTALSASEINSIYHRQKQKYAGHYDSPVIDLGASGNWTNLDTITSLPFGKEIVTQSRDNSLDYIALNSDLSDGIVAYWKMNGDWLNSSSNSFNGSAVGDVGFSSENIISGKSGVFDGSTAGVSLPGAPINPGTGDATISAWVKTGADFSTNAYIYYDRGAVSTNQFNLLYQSDETVTVFCRDSGSNIAQAVSGVKLADNKWHHLVATRNATSCNLYVDGKLADEATNLNLNDIDMTGGHLACIGIGGGSCNGQEFTGMIDEVAGWSRALTSTEIKQLYQRGANRLKYQVKSCVDSSCNCKSFNTSPTGSASDCDGDGTPNSSDTDDNYKAEFIGPGGDGSTQYSELFNRAPADLTFNCTSNTSDSDNNICVDDEITFQGETNASSPSFTFSDMATSASPINNRYFQYRVLMESEENSACSNEPCLPDLTSVEVGPTGRYYGGSPVISSNTPLSFNRFKSILFKEEGSCSITYQLSLDGLTYYYFDGVNWVTAGSEVTSLSSSSSQITSNIDSFIGTSASGNLYFKAFLNSDTGQSCAIDSISIRDNN